jgi:thiamine phosphate synthase YjbQ (UPF0047 family)
VTIHSGLLRLQTEGEGQIVDLTEGVLAVVRQSGVTAGLVAVFATGPAAAVTTLEPEPGGRVPERLLPRGDAVPAHLRAALLGRSETVPLAEGRLALGPRQQLVLIDFDDRPGRLEVHVQIVS